MLLASFAQAKLAVSIFCLGVAASFDGGMIILVQRLNILMELIVADTFLAETFCTTAGLLFFSPVIGFGVENIIHHVTQNFSYRQENYFYH